MSTTEVCSKEHIGDKLANVFGSFPAAADHDHEFAHEALHATEGRLRSAAFAFRLAGPKFFREDFAMRTLLVFLLVLAASFSPALRAADAKRLTVVDYYLQLPDKTFEGPAKGWLRFLRQPKCGVEDPAHGYLSCTGDGAQPPFAVALFRYKDDRPLLAVCQGELEGKNAKYLTFYEPGPGGRMHEAKRSIFPIADETGYLFELPRMGRTVLVRTEKGGRLKAKYTWDGAKFVEER